MDQGSISHLVRKILNLDGPRFENWQDGGICAQMRTVLNGICCDLPLLGNEKAPL
jgi:hypothetical protein